MAIARYYTVGAVVPDIRSLEGLMGRLNALELAPDSVVVLARRRDERLLLALLPEARVQSVGGGLSRRQWVELASTFFSASTVSFLISVVHLWTGLLVQAALTVAVGIGLVIYHRSTDVEKKLLRLGMPQRLAQAWEASFLAGFALLLATVAEEDFSEVQDAFLDDDALLSPLAADRRPVL